MSRRADRLFQIVQILRGRRLSTAALLAERLEVSERTIYRDIRDLSLSGVPIEGEAGCGYRLLPGYDLPPLMFTPGEVEALVAAIRLVQTWSGETLAQAAGTAEEKLLGVLTPQRRVVAERCRIISPDFNKYPQVKTWFDIFHRAIGELQVLHVCYEDEKGRTSNRNVHPLGLTFWGEVWLLVAWCEVREDYRSFRLDRCASVDPTGRYFSERPDRSLAHFIQLQQSEGCLPETKKPIG
ncbi:helix-turn-helix transcriptional regulator [Buttiauxella ferragutiae]|uniref:helix-turn-helix transcriptional regulator n=1 Tax=Buttiauxella ferragutiae TaxID=82989 RepID=UPI001F532185|nr:YafY family protein [Buttiauxella ferragutiae]UNK60463.1 YafY family transcriptional regulator [Buttiauxella ferragutiae]